MKVNLKVKEDNTVQTIQHEVEELSIRQVTNSIKTVKGIIDIIQEDQHLQVLLVEMFESQQDDEEKSDDDFGQVVLKNAVGAMDVLLMELPDKALELLAILSGIEHDTLMEQKAEDVFDIYDAVIQVNDIEKLIKRAKKSLALTKAQTKVMNLFPKKEEQDQKPA